MIINAVVAVAVVDDGRNYDQRNLRCVQVNWSETSFNFTWEMISFFFILETMRSMYRILISIVQTQQKKN